MKAKNQKLRQLKKLVEADRLNSGPKPRYSLQVKALIRDLFSTGTSVSVLASTTGITVKSIHTWTRLVTTNIEPEVFKPLLVSDENIYEVVFPNGMKVQGLSFEQLMEFARHATAA